MKKQNVPASVKDEKLIEIRRNQMIKGAVSLFKEKGFHRTTTREIAKAAGFSIGTLYEYIGKKEDVLYLVCDRIYDEVSERLKRDIDPKKGDTKSLLLAIKNYFKVMDEMQDEVLVMYQEAKSLSKEDLPYVLKKELEMVEMFEAILKACVENGEFDLHENERKLIAHNIFVQGQMWGFRRWALQKLYSLEEYTNSQIENLLTGINR
ncbi:TetR/AcrR family transcriptional regulator [Bacillus suaedaesalsae]|uniref:TetR/AcrR family transcriptional regulator n=1 Tax=Bacillus suaedaesalsae TaxID=2810349 RepID=A0ABS2DE97_9BACI|nr:TetR/AcrR family transcriptional regulator [Bacillus suaedaesalsae]MBM6616780.1 TetR/AcrR family transcriptional regulator [Bacillus suaedaesalsae]